MKTLYTAHATATGGRGGKAATDDNNLAVELSTAGGPSKKAKTTNPEQLFACGYAACFGSALEAVAKKQGTMMSGEVKVMAEVNLNQDDKGGYFLAVTLNAELPGLEDEAAAKLVEAAHQICPYSKATRGNIDVTLKVGDHTISKAA